MIVQDTRRATWMQLATPEAVADAIIALYAEHGGERYDEVVTQSEHAVQAAQCAIAEGATNALVVAALLHDIGHLLENGATARPTLDLHHESVGARFLGNWFHSGVTEPIRLHVEAKRYLCAIEPAYVDGLSPASVHSMKLQGGPMSDQQVAAFAELPSSASAVRLRRWDDFAKDAESSPECFADFRDIMLAVLRES